MGRPLSYDQGSVLTAAMHAFRRKGYAAVSIRDLEEATGLKAGSIYHSYGDKAGLFQAAFAHYNQAVLCRRIKRFAPENASLSGLRALFLSLLREPNGESFGCLITNSAIEFGGDSTSPAGVNEGFQILLGAFTDRLSSALRAGALRSGIDPTVAASKLLALYQGILVLIRAGWDTAALRTLINAEFNGLERISS